LTAAITTCPDPDCGHRAEVHWLDSVIDPTTAGCYACFDPNSPGCQAGVDLVADLIAGRLRPPGDLVLADMETAVREDTAIAGVHSSPFEAFDQERAVGEDPHREMADGLIIAAAIGHVPISPITPSGRARGVLFRFTTTVPRSGDDRPTVRPFPDRLFVFATPEQAEQVRNLFDRTIDRLLADWQEHG
jgi:hypothetical protein